MSKIVKFYGDSCSPCASMSPVFEDVVKDLGLTNVESKRIGDEGVREMAMELGIRTIPSFVVYSDNGKVFTKSGIMSKETLKSFIEESLS